MRGEIGNLDLVIVMQHFALYGDPFGAQPPAYSFPPFAFTGEMRDTNGLQYHRARYYNPILSMWTNLDPIETPNRYSYVDGNPVNLIDPSGLCNLFGLVGSGVACGISL